MTRDEWLKEARKYERKAASAWERGKPALYQMYYDKAQACRENADYGTVNDAEKGA